MLDFVKKYGYDIYSQNGESGIIKECLLRMDLLSSGVGVEFGAPTKKYCSNIYHLQEFHGWDCAFFDSAPREEGVVKLFVDTSNVNTLPPCSVLSIDIDGNDYEVWKAYTGTPDIVIIEINSSLPPMKAHFSLDRGASYITMALLALEKGYFILCHTGNLLCLRNDHRHLFPEIIGDGLNNWRDYFNTNWLP